MRPIDAAPVEAVAAIEAIARREIGDDRDLWQLSVELLDFDWIATGQQQPTQAGELGHAGQLGQPIAAPTSAASAMQARMNGFSCRSPRSRSAVESGEERMAVTARLGAFKTSMLQDVEAGRAIELEALVGAPREIGRRVGVATPNIDTLYAMTRLMAESRGLL